MTMTEDKVILLYEGDIWLSSHSLSLLGIFTSEKNLERYVANMKAKGVIDAYGYDCLIGNIESARGQATNTARDMAFLIERTSVNPLTYE